MPPRREAEIEKLIMQGLKEVTMHEVGHTLGLRHNFKASKLLYAGRHERRREDQGASGLTGSVMDYAPANIVPKGVKQGDYYSTTIGPYDMWAIEYGYKPLAGGTPEGEVGGAEEDRRPQRRAGRWPMPPTKTPAASTPIR